ncbi:transposase [Nostoc sp. FACHB-133]|uniref:transposase n=1 Tax=Nostoc sp. FACHB-133 TaxID=2692835 RepID=UPI001F555B9A|nr:transposase [Nostoc sp. FACHB-133]
MLPGRGFFKHPLTRLECCEVFIYAIKKAQEKYKFKLYALCIMSNHVHYLLEAKQPEDGLALIYKKLFSRQSCTKVAIACNRQSTENMTFSPACYTIRLTEKNVTADLNLALVNED